MKTKIMLVSLTFLALIVSACGAATPVPAVPTSAPVIAPTVAPTAVVPVTGTTPTAAQSGGPAAVDLGQSASLGSFLVDSKGMTLYMFAKDTPNQSNCNGGCLKAWPALLTSGTPTAGTGVDASLLGTITRSDGSTQVTYNKMPLYYFAADKAAGDTKGQGVQNVWFVVDASGKPVGSSAAASASGSGSSSSGSSGSGAMVNASQNATLGSFLADSKGMTLYIFTKDAPNKSNCYATCATYWPPLLTTGSPVAGTGLTATMLGTTTRTDGSTQVTYNGWPLYYYIGDKAAGDTNGENVQNVWFVITPGGTKK